jgi:hypothetical protein
MRRAAWKSWIMAGLLMTCGLSYAGRLEDHLESRWSGAWVLTGVDTYSDCNGIRTNNDVSGRLVRSRGHYAFRPGELARIVGIDVKHSGIKLSLSLPEPILVSNQDGPFTLYNEARCALDLDVDLPRSVIKNEDRDGIEEALAPLLKRFENQETATASRDWNGRRREEYPADYDRTLANHAAWKAEQANTAIRARLDQASDETSRITDRISGNPDYLKGFASGVEAVKALELTGCNDLMARDFQNIVPKPPAQSAAYLSPSAADFQRGFQDGGRLVYGLELLRRLPGCMVAPPTPSEPPYPPQR